MEYLKLAIRWASDAGAPVVNTDEDPKPEWTTKEMDYQLMTYTLKVTGTPVGCACGDGVVDWKKAIDFVKTCPADIVFNVEC